MSKIEIFSSIAVLISCTLIMLCEMETPLYGNLFIEVPCAIIALIGWIFMPKAEGM